MDAIRREADSIRAEPEVTYRQLLTSEALRWPLLVAVVMMVAQQFSGINVNFYGIQMEFINFRLSSTIQQRFSNWMPVLEKPVSESYNSSIKILQASRWASCVVFLLYVFFTLISTWLVDFNGIVSNIPFTG